MDKCVKCGKPLGNFSGYIPEEGEACLQCYMEHLEKDENVLVTRKKENPH
jgi:recombinational DNA repair protein (RecF pathway)